MRLTIAALAVFLVNYLWNFAQRSVVVYRADQYQKTAEGLLAKNKNDEAFTYVQKALFLVPDHIGSCRLMARLLDAHGDPRALEYYRFVALDGSILPGEIQLGDASSDASAFFDGGGDVLRSGDKFSGVKEEAALSPNATREDAMNLALAAVKYGRLIVAWDVANLLSGKWRDSVFPHLVKASINAKMGDPGAQELELRTALSKAENLETLTAFFQFLLSQPRFKPERSAELVRVLDKITRLDTSQSSLQLCIKTISSGDLEQEDILSILQIIRNHPASDSMVLLFADKFHLGLEPAMRSQMLQNLVNRSLALPVDQRLPAVDWLLDIKESKLAEGVLPLSDALSSPKSFEMWVEVAIDLKRWSDIDKALANTANPLPPYRTQALEATIAGIKGNPGKSRELWDSVLSKNKNRPEVFLELLVMLIRLGEWKILYQELPVLLNDPAWALKSMETLIPVARQHRDSVLMLEFYRQAMKCRIIANADTIKDRAAYTRLILGESVRPEELEQRSKKNPENLSFRMTYALGLLKNGAKVKALFELKDVEPSIQVDALLPHQKAVYAAILHANGQAEDAQAILKTISSETLTHQEEALTSAISAAHKVD